MIVYGLAIVNRGRKRNWTA